MFFYGICNPFATDKASKAGLTPAAITITMMWVLLVVNVVSVVAPFIITWVKDLLHEPKNFHQFAFMFMAVVAYISAIVIFARRMILKKKNGHNPVIATAAATGTTAPSDAPTNAAPTNNNSADSANK